MFSLSTEEKLELISQKLKRFKNQSNNFKAAFIPNNNLTAASFSVSHCIVQHDLPISRNTVKERILCMSGDISNQLQTDLASADFFSICLDESTDVTSQARVAVFVLFISVNIMKEELIKLITISTKTTGRDIMDEVHKEFINLKINIQNIVSITTDGAPNMVGKNNGFIKLFSNEILHPLINFHCIIHQEALCAKDSMKSLQKVMETVTKIVNFITSRALNNRQFAKLLEEVESQYSGLLMYNSVRWLSRGQVLHRFVELLAEVRLFLSDKSQDYPELTDLNWLNDLMFFTDFTAIYNDLNKKLQGRELKLSFFEWLNIDNLEMELIEFQGSNIWRNKFINLNNELENNHHEIGRNFKSENLILNEWKSLPNSFASMKKLALSLLTMFGSTYACEQLFSSMNFIKSTVRNRLGTDLSEACVQLKSTKYSPRIDSLANKMQQQISH
ncbi:general transcription factor II-I repeat domain-containing protein 2A-like [Daktulosphaira vitifoliae]|uniref:general transcription factor II-I repeat domain-containing protein 2A-like n=1 Tax=Daktulosphaira vitifoliae TaxID=58002 RepID=UPI0021A99952|nr:general transcription factor II-I repeat domain-containing protein 2A-like [Daktulosphaira vitifoliae]